MHIAICDDNPQDLKQAAGMMEKYATAHRLSLAIQTFSDAENMISATRDKHFSHYFLDIMMPSMDGITAAQEIRALDAEAKIIFFTSSKDFAYQSYRVKAYDYLLKPLKEEMLFSLLDQLQAEEESFGECICFQNGRSIFRIPYRNLSHLEVNQKKLYFHLADGQILRIPGAMQEFEEELLQRTEFIKFHRSYIVNLNQVSVLSPEGCVMFSRKNLPVSRLLYNQVRQQYMAHLFVNGEV